MDLQGLHPLRSHPVQQQTSLPLHPSYLHPSQLPPRSPMMIQTSRSHVGLSHIGLPKSPRPEHRFTPASPRSPTSFMTAFNSSPSSERGLGFSTSPSSATTSSPVSPGLWSTYTRESEKRLIPQIAPVPSEPPVILPAPRKKKPDHVRQISTHSSSDEGERSDSSSSSSSSIVRLTRKLKLEVRQCFSPNPSNYSPASPNGYSSKIEAVHWTEL